MKRPPIIVRDETMRQRVIELVSALDLAKPWQITVEPWIKKRSLDQNALYWKWLTVIHNDTGQDKDDIHEVMMRKFLEPRTVWPNERPTIDLITGRLKPPENPIEVWSTRKLTTAEFSEYLDKIHGWAASTLGIALPLPEEMHRND